ncbi:inhibitor of nuclear factor kappa-B kinase-interacting protein [Diretmus argenteus]
MPQEVKQRKKNQSQKQNDELSETPDANGKDEAHKVKPAAGGANKAASSSSSSSSLDLKSIMCVLSLAACGALTWLVLQQSERFSDMEEKYRLLHGDTARLFHMEEEVLKVSKKLAASDDDLQEARATVSLATRLQKDVSTLHAAVMAMQTEENSASRNLQTVNAHFLNVTETWQGRLAAITSDLTALKAESREAHAGATEGVNEAERRARSLAERLEELEDSTRGNARALERTEEEDAKRAQKQLDWNTKQIHKLEEQVAALTRREAELLSQLQEHIPRAQQCEAHLPEVEEAVRSILRLGGDLSGAEQRLEEVTLQVFGTEDNMLKALTEILAIRQELDTLHTQNSILKMKNELSVVKEAVRELTMVFRDHKVNSCESVQVMLEGLGARGLQAQLEGLEQDVRQLRDWASGLTEKRAQLQTSLTALRDAVGQIEERTAAITKDVTNKVASVRTDVRRMDGLQSEVESLLSQVGELEDKAAQVERNMVKRIGDALANSIDRVSNLRDSSERNAQAIEKLRRRIPELVAADGQISERLRELESGRARLIRTVTFAADLKPKVAAIKRDFGAFEPQLADLTVRIGRLAEDLTKREQDVADLRQTLGNLSAVEGDLGVTTKEVSEMVDIPEVGEMLLQANGSQALPQMQPSGE